MIALAIGLLLDLDRLRRHAAFETSAVPAAPIGVLLHLDLLAHLELRAILAAAIAATLVMSLLVRLVSGRILSVAVILLRTGNRGRSRNRRKQYGDE